MIALLLAASLTAAAPAPAPSVSSAVRPLIQRNGLNYIPSACRAGVTVAASPEAWSPKIRRLGDLPKAHLEIAVNRTVGGCAAPLIVQYDVEGDGRAAGGSGN
ncbi:MAG: hypothetical protein E7812_16185 [Phenylobacterium sp.]|nr:MAG: hypothetical protein E7812_16185 [Phenylobacterium sp.]